MVNLTLADTYGSYNLFAFEGKYYAVSQDIHEDNVLEIIQDKKALVGDSTKVLIGKIRNVEDWANARGMYGLHDEQEANQKILRANSFNTYQETIGKNYKNPIRLKTKQGIFVVEAVDIGLSSASAGRVINLSRDSRVSLINAISADAQPELIFQYGEYNIVEYDKIYYGIPLAAGDLNLKEINLSEVPGLISAELTKDVMLQIDRLSAQTVSADYKPPQGGRLWLLPKIRSYIGWFNFFSRSKSRRKVSNVSPVWQKELHTAPELIEELPDHNIVRFKGYYFLVGRDLGELDLSSLTDQELFRLRHSLDLAALIEGPLGGSETARLVQELPDHHIVRFKGYYFLVGRDLGEVNLASLTDQELFALRHSVDLADLIEGPLGGSETARLVQELPDHHIVRFKGYYFLVGRDLGELDLSSLTDQELFRLRHSLDLADLIEGPLGGSETARLEEELPNHNIVRFREYYFLLGRDVGDLDLSSLTDQELFALPHSRILADLKKQLAAQTDMGFMDAIKTHGGYNIFLFESVYFAIPEGTDKFDFINDDLMDRPDVKYDIVLAALEDLIDDENSLNRNEEKV